MAASKYLVINPTTGGVAEQASINTTTGVDDEGKIPALDADGLLNQNMMPKGLKPDTASLVADGALAAGDFVAVAANGKVKKADGTSLENMAIGFVVEDVLDTEIAFVYLEGTNKAVVATLTPGTRYFIDVVTPGLPSATPPAGTGRVVQYLGRATGTNSITFEPSDGIVLA